MSLPTGRFPDPVGGVGPQARAAAVAIGLCVGGVLAGVALLLAASLLVAPLIPAGITDSVVVDALSARQLLQVGFLAVAAAYLYRADDPGRYVKVRRPTPEDVGWILAIPVALIALAPVVAGVEAVLGAGSPAGAGDHAGAVAFRPAAWAVTFVGLYLFAAPAEELLFRGVIQGRLRGPFGTAGVVVGGAAAFGLMHFLLGMIQPNVGVAGALVWVTSTFLGGLLYGYAYERTGNLLVPSVVHAMMWTVPFGAILPFV